MSLIGHNMIRTKSTNKCLVLQALLRYGSISRQQISEITQLTPATITNLTRELIEEGLLKETGNILEEKKRAGRKSISIDLNDHALWVIGIFVQRTTIDIGLVGLKGQVEQSRQLELKPDLNPEQFLALLSSEIKQFMDSTPSYHVLAVGIGVDGRVDFDQGMLIHEEFRQWHSLEIVKTLRKQLKLPVYLDNNARTITLAEKLYGNSKGDSNLLNLFVDDDIQAALILSDQLYRGGLSGGLQLGHMIYDPDGRVCWCGNKGCIQQYAAVQALLKELNVSETKLMNNIANKEPATMHALSLAGQRIGTVLASFLNLIYVERIIISGKLVSEGSPLVDHIINTINERSFIANENHIQIYPSSIKQDAGLIGAASLALYYEIFHRTTAL